MKPVCIESTINVIVGGINIRLWLNHKEIPGNHMAEQELIKRLIKLEGFSLNAILEWILAKVENLNAVEVRDGAIGTVVYCVPWEEGKDPHG